MAYETAPIRGVEVHYGTRTTNQKFGSDFGTKDGVKQRAYTYSATDLPAADDNNLTLNFPAYSKVLSVYTEVIEAVTLGGDRTGATVTAVVGSYDSGAEALSAVTRGGSAMDESGPTLIGTTSAELVITMAATGGASGEVTGGRLRTIVEFIDEGA